MANKRNQAKKAKKAARDAEFVAAHAHKIEAIRSKATPQKPASNPPPHKDHLPVDNGSSKQLQDPPASAGKVPLDEDMPKVLLKTTSNASTIIKVSASSVHNTTAAPAAVSGAKADNPNPDPDTPRPTDNSKHAATNSIVAKTEQLPAPADKHGKVPLDEDIPKGLLKTTSNASTIIKVPAISVHGKIAAPAVASGAKTCHPDAPRINQDTATNSIVAKTEQLPAPADKHGAEPPKRSVMRKLLVGATAGVALGVAKHVAATAATISAVAMAVPACKTKAPFGMLGGIFSKALAIAVLPVSLVSAIAA